MNSSPVWKTRGRNSVNNSPVILDLTGEIDENDEDFQFTWTKSSKSTTPASNVHADSSNTNADLQDEFSPSSSPIVSQKSRSNIKLEFSSSPTKTPKRSKVRGKSIDIGILS